MKLATALLEETRKSQELGKPTDELIKLWWDLIKRSWGKRFPNHEHLREDCYAQALYYLFKNAWRTIQLEKSPNAFAYYYITIKSAFIEIIAKDKRQGLK